jgi:hypothetical protein
MGDVIQLYPKKVKRQDWWVCHVPSLVSVAQGIPGKKRLAISMLRTDK